MRILVTGITSIHGWPIFCELGKRFDSSQLWGVRPPKADQPDLPNVSSVCITNRAELQELRDSFQPTHVVHCAGVCDLDVCEERPEWAYDLNVRGTEAMVEIFGTSLPLYYMSTDLVFSGSHPPAGGYAEAHPPDPISVAGSTFLQAEALVQACPEHCILRLGLPLGDSVQGHKGAIDWIENRFRRGLPVTLFHDELRSCIDCHEIGEMVALCLAHEVRGLYHLGGTEPWTLHEIGRHVIEKGGYSPDLLTGILRHEEKDGPPRIGDVSLNSSALRSLLNGKTLVGTPLGTT